MSQPNYVPLKDIDKVRTTERLPVPDSWRQDRPAELLDAVRPMGPKLGTPGPDQGYGLKLAKRFVDKLQLAAGEHAADAVAGCNGVACRRAALYGRAPVIYDYELAFTLWGFLGDAPAELVAFRTPLFAEASHHYWDQRQIVDLVPEATLRLSPAEVRSKLRDWRGMLDTTWLI